MKAELVEVVVVVESQGSQRVSVSAEEYQGVDVCLLQRSE